MKNFYNNIQKWALPQSAMLFVTGSALFIFLLYLLYFQKVLHFNMFRSDVLQYWKMSFHWYAPFNVWWAPGYPLLIAFIRTITFNVFSPLTIMTGISLVAFLIAVYTIYKGAEENKCHNPAFFSLLFVFFPFVGLNFTVFPMADISTVALFFCATRHLKNSRLKHFVFFSSLALLFHKIMWFFIPPLTIWGFFTIKKSPFYFILPYLPLLLWIVAGAYYHDDIFWFVRSSYDLLVTSKRTFFLFDGVISSLCSTSLPKIIRGIILLSFTIFTTFCFYWSSKHKYWISAGICFSLLAVSATVNYFEAWVIARYSKLLLIPIISMCSHIHQTKELRILMLVILAVFLLSNMIFGLYMVKVFYT